MSTRDDFDFDFEAERRRAPRNTASRPNGTRAGSPRPNGSRSNGTRRPAGSRPDEYNRQGGSRQGAPRQGAARPNSSRAGQSRRGGAKAKKKTKRTIFIVEIILVVLLLLGLLLWMKFGRMNWDNSISIADLEVNELDAETEEILDNYTTIAMFGVDNRSNGDYKGGNSDSIMIVSINNDTKEVNVVSVARDTYLNVDDGSSYRKCNYAYNHGGPEQAINMLNKNLDLKVSGYVAVDFYALAEIVDDLGGLELEITQAMVDATNPENGGPALAGYIAEVQTVIGDVDESEWYLKPGVQNLNGSQVVGYCRQRYLAGNDFGRAERQREVVKKIVEKTVHSDAKTLNKIVDDVLPDVSTSLSASQVLGMATSASDYKITQSCGFPFDLTTGTYGNKGSLVVPCTLEDNVTKLHEFLYGQEDYDPTETVKDISSKISSDTGTSSESATENQEND